MEFEIESTGRRVTLFTEARFTLIDFIFLFACLLLGLTTYTFFLAFAFGYVAKIFTRYEYRFDKEREELIQRVHIFGVIRLKIRTVRFDAIRQVLFTNYESGVPIWPDSWIGTASVGVILETETRRLVLAKVGEGAKEEAEMLYDSLEAHLEALFTFRYEYLSSDN